MQMEQLQPRYLARHLVYRELPHSTRERQKAESRSKPWRSMTMSLYRFRPWRMSSLEHVLVGLIVIAQDARYTATQKGGTTVQIILHVDMGASRLSIARTIWPYHPVRPRSNISCRSLPPMYLHHRVPILAISTLTIRALCQMATRPMRRHSSACSSSSLLNAAMVVVNVHLVLARVRRNVVVVAYDALVRKMEKAIPI
jgi:hypothetical protein